MYVAYTFTAVCDSDAEVNDIRRQIAAEVKSDALPLGGRDEREMFFGGNYVAVVNYTWRVNPHVSMEVIAKQEQDLTPLLSTLEIILGVAPSEPAPKPHLQGLLV